MKRCEAVGCGGLLVGQEGREGILSCIKCGRDRYEVKVTRKEVPISGSKKEEPMPKECNEIVGGKKCRTRIGPHQEKCGEHREPPVAPPIPKNPDPAKAKELVGSVQRAIEEDFSRTHEAIMHPEGTTHFTGLSAIIEEKPMSEPGKTKPPKTSSCFFCAENIERTNDVGHITIKDPDGNERDIFVCHFCGAEGLRDLLSVEADTARYAHILGALMFRRALDSRA